MSKARLCLALACLPLLAGCLRLGPDFAAPGSPTPPPAAYQHQEAGAGAYVETDAWWKLLGDPELDALVEKALVRNYDLAKAAGRVLEVRASLTQAGAARWPQVNLNANTQRQRTQISSPLIGQPLAATTDAYSLSLAASFELDLWGRLARTEEAARADLLAEQENRRVVTQTVVAEVAAAYLEAQALERRIQVAEKTITAFDHSVAFVDGRYQRGLVSVLDLHQARRSLASAQAALPGLRQDLSLRQQRLMVLAGDYPRASPARKHPVDYYRQPPEVPAGLPSELLLRRPDLRRAESSLHALTARVGAARAARFPRISLTGGFGYASGELGDLFTPVSELWSIAGGLSQSVFDAGNLAAGEAAARARLMQGQAEYAKTVLNAFAEVEGALLTRQEQIERRRLVVAALDEAVNTQEVAESRYLRGLTDYLTVLDAQRARYGLEDTLVLTELAVLTNYVTLHRALGGGWASPPPLDAIAKDN
ncbi:MAG: efflux transporter outer membrane subunit [Thermodesulfobacteriota bacterium]